MTKDKDLSLADILSVEDREIEKVFVEKWKGNIYIRVLSAKERSEVEDLFTRMQQGKNFDTGKFRKELLKRVWVDSQGNPMIADEAIAQNVMGKSATAIEDIFEKACELNAFRKKDVEELKKK